MSSPSSKDKIFGLDEQLVRPEGDLKGWIFNGLADRIDSTMELPDEYIRRCRNHLLDFTRHTFTEYKADPFHCHVCENITELVTHEHEKWDRLMLFAPPQHGKSEIVSTRLPSFWLGHHPELPVALVSYGASLAFRNSRYARYVIESHQFGQIFPEFRPDLMNWRMQDWHLKDRKGYVFAAGVGGPITGHGFGLVIIDDPIENWAAAQSDLRRESVWQWWLGTLKTRIWEEGRIVLMMTRWHEDDLAGRILAQEGRIEEGGKWKVLSYPALAEEEKPEKDIIGREYGAPLAPSRFSAEYLREMRDSVSSHVWGAEYQQHPTAPEGDFFKVGRIQIVEALPAGIGRTDTLSEVEGFIPVELKKGVRFWDMAATEKKQLKEDPDSTSGTLLSEDENLFYICDNLNEQLGPYEVEDIIKLTAKVDGRAVKIRIEQEPGASGKTLIAYYVRQLKGFDIEGWPSTGNKMTKAAPFAAQVNAGNVRMLKGPWNRRMLMQLAAFPHGRHDDDVDSASGSFNAVTTGEKKRAAMEFKRV